MPNARILLIAGLGFASLAACHKSATEQQNADQNMALDDGLPGGVPANADIEALPQDESSVTPSNQLQKGIDGPDVNDTSANAE